MATISMHHVKAALRGVLARGYPADELVSKAGIHPALLDKPVSRVSDDQMTRLVRLIWRLTDDEFMGFTNHSCRLGTFNLMARAVYRQDHLRDALQLGCDLYNRFQSDILTRLVEGKHEASIEVTFVAPELDPENFFLEFWLIALHRFSSWMTATRIPLRATRLRCPRPTHAAELNYLFPGQQEFECAANQLCFSSEYLNLPLLRNRRQLRRFIVRAPAGLMTIPGDDHRLQSRIERLVTPSEVTVLQFPSLEQIARQLHLSPQSLHRRLSREGTSWQRIKDGIRRDMALTMLVHERKSVNEVAERVGFAEARSFTRAFKQWTGLSPREYCKFV